ncbi:MAG: right-handed parallel beta-helix repeat-containing protein, partial [Verrucomicrobiota bacterium]
LTLSSLPAATPPPILTFETGKTPTTEIHVDTATGNDTTGDGSLATPYATIARGIQDAVPGAAVRIHPGTYNVRVNITDLAGTATNPIWIGGVPGQTKPIIQGQSEGVHLTRTRYLILHDLEVRNTSQNGINCDDGSQYANPDATRYMIFRDLYVHDIGGTGNQDGIKLSGVDDYFVLNCQIDTIGGGISGAGVDHVGCHNGILAYNEISNTAGSGIQCKGGTSDLEIRGNRITDFGQRSVNIGGSTDFQFFRPPLSTTDPNFEAKNIRLIANIIKGGVASLAFVGCVDCEAVNNTFIDPDNWQVRILQETTSTATYNFLACANNTVKNNIFYFDRSTLSNSTINIGANTNAPSFTWTNNLWFAHNNPAQSTPNPNPTQSNAIFGDNPDFADPATDDYRLQAGSPAIGNGLALPANETDFAGAPYKNPPAIGAFEVTAWQAWRALHFPLPAQLADPTVSGPHATPGGDDIPNYTKFAFNLLPFQNESAQLPFATLATDHLQFAYTRPVDSECHVAVTIEVSPNLADWFSGPTHTLTNPPLDLGNGTEQITVDDLTLLPSATRRFMRAAIQFLDGG